MFAKNSYRHKATSRPRELWGTMPMVYNDRKANRITNESNPVGHHFELIETYLRVVVEHHTQSTG